MDLNKIIEELKTKVEDSKQLNEDPFDKDWNYQVGILLSRDACENIIKHLESNTASQPKVDGLQSCGHCLWFNTKRTSSEYLDGYCEKIHKSFNKDFRCKYFTIKS